MTSPMALTKTPRPHEVRLNGHRIFYVRGDAGAGYTEPHTSVTQVSGAHPVSFAIPTRIVASWQVLSAPLDGRHADVHACEDCGLPTSYAIGSYWLASDKLWKRVAGDDSIVLCPGCFCDRADAKDVSVFWQARRMRG